jgi:hypothetical protein
MKIKFSIFFIIFFLSFNINAEISQSGITGLKQLDSNGINELISGNQLTGLISDGPFQGPITHSFYKNGKYETIFDDKIFNGIWKVENKRLCSKKNTASNFNCVYWYTGSKDGATYAYIIAQGKIFQQFHENISLDQLIAGVIETDTIIEYDNGTSIQDTAENTGQKKIETIIANGIGTSIQEAAQNAAENALTQAVGSFIDATTMMEKQTVITDGIVSRSKVINKDIKEYSQGSIQFFEILDTKQTSGIFRLTARVDVRIEDFRAYIKELASGTQEISSGLFAQMKTDQDNTQDRLSLVIDKILLPIMAGEVHNIEVQSPIPLKRFIEVCPSISEETFFSLGQRHNYSRQNYSICDSLKRIGNRSKIAVFPFSISLKDEFFENMTNIFDNVSNSKREYFNNASINKIEWRENDTFVVVNNNKGVRESSAKSYVLDNFDSEAYSYLNNKFEYGGRILRPYEIDTINRGHKNCFWNNDLIFKILDENSNVIVGDVLQTCRDKVTGIYSGMTEVPILSLYAASLAGPRLILSTRHYFLLMELSPKVLEKAKSVEMSYVQN